MIKKLDRTTRFVLFTMSFSIITVINALIHGGWLLATITAFIVFGLYLLYIWRYRDEFLTKLVLFGLAAGMVELLADCWSTKVGWLVYYPGGPFVMCSPLYMPLGWAIMMVQIGYLGWLFVQKWGLPIAMLATGLVGAINIPINEYLAKSALLWYYQNVPMLFGVVPYAVIFAECLICLVLPPIVLLVKKHSWRWSILLGVAEGFWMWGIGVVGYYLFGTT